MSDLRDVEICRLQEEIRNLRIALATNSNAAEALLALLKEARQYVSDAGNDEDPETQRHSRALLASLDFALALGGL